MKNCLSSTLRSVLSRLPLLSLAALSLAGTASAAIVIQPTDESTSKDTKIYISVPDGNFSSNLSVVSPDITPFLSLVQFDLSSINLPASEITGATLTLSVYAIGLNGGTGGTVTLKPILDSWRENSTDPGTDPLATYNNFFGATPTIHAGDVVASQSITAVGTYSWDITDTVKRWVDGSLPNNGLLIEVSTAGGDIGIDDVDNNGPASAPKLTVVPEPASAALLVGAGVALLARRRRTAAAGGISH